MKEEFHPSVAFYESDTKAAVIRACSAEIVTTLKQLIYAHDEAVDKSEAYARLERLEEELIDYGISTEIHIGQPIDFFSGSPLHAAEYCAGQLINILGKEFVREADIISMGQEHDLLDAETPGQPFLIDTKITPEKLRIFNNLVGAINIVELFLVLEA